MSGERADRRWWVVVPSAVAVTAIGLMVAGAMLTEGERPRLVATGPDPSTGSTTVAAGESQPDRPELSVPDTVLSSDTTSATSMTALATEPTSAPDPDATVDPTGSPAPSVDTDSARAVPGPLPDCRIGCVLVLEGDSLTASLHDFLCVKIPKANCVNSGAGGKRIDEMINSAPGDVDPLATGGTDDVLILWAGINDLRQQRHSKDPAENARLIAGYLGDYIAQRRAAGWDYVFVVDMPPSSAEIPGWAELNTILRNDRQGADALIDIAADPALVNPTDGRYKLSDGIHFSDPGSKYLVDTHLLPALLGGSS